MTDQNERATSAEQILFTQRGGRRIDDLADRLVQGCDLSEDGVVDVLDTILNGDLDTLCRGLGPAGTTITTTTDVTSRTTNPAHRLADQPVQRRAASGRGR